MSELKDKATKKIQYDYPKPELQNIKKQTVSYIWNAEKHMEKVLSELHNIKDEEL